ncbi:hypothetical protein J2Y69_002767 [Microbacterium resistens]|uniref:Uncharacterized protein n=1 Tax=Microbacterium resistens TaxID=156977 RepID=A0ABU1SEZ0_9MICO|nr:hypothetical protein [Microbacterium resistens]MDR6868156.1 hypothetical protein [Microbacterium resistens]
MRNSSVGGDGIRIYDGGRLLVTEGGGIDIVDTGYINIDGNIRGVGRFDWEGVFHQLGPSVFQGPTTFQGPVTITGPDGKLTVEKETLLKALTRVLADLVIEEGGKAVIGNMVIDPTIGGGSVVFQNGGQLFSNADTVQLYLGNSVAQISDDYARLQHAGYVIEIDATGVKMSRGAVRAISGTGTPEGTLHQDDDGYLRRSDGS